MDRKVLGAAVAALVLAMAGCGSSATLSRADFTKQANAICTKRRAAIAKAQSQHRNDFKGTVKQVLPQYSKSVDQLAGLKAPAEVKPRLAQLVAIERAQLRRIEAAIAGRRATSSESVAANHKQADI